jgi:hypothetical protein
MALDQRRAGKSSADAGDGFGIHDGLDPKETVVLKSHFVAHAQIDVPGILDDQRAARIEAHGNAIARTVRLPFVDLRACDRAADRASDGRRRVTTAAADLVTDDAAAKPPSSVPALTGWLSAVT